MNLDAQFAFLDDLPESLYTSVVTLHHGSLRERVTGILAWRHALLRGVLPSLSRLSWPERRLAEIILQRLDALELAPLCRNEEALVDHILQDVCRAVAAILRREEQGIHGLFDDVVDGQQKQAQGAGTDSGGSDGSDAASDADDVASEAAGPTLGKAAAPAMGGTEAADGRTANDEPSPPAIAPATAADTVQGAAAAETEPESPDHSTLAADAGTAVEPGQDAASPTTDTTASVPDVPPDSVAELGDTLDRHWAALLEHWQQTSAVFRGMGSRLGRGWDLSSGDLHGEDWRRFVAYRKLIRRHPQLKAIVDSLGRDAMVPDAGPIDDTPRASEGPGETPAPQSRLVHTESPLSMSGVSRSDDIARMLPQEAAFLGHPRLKMLWHARRAEQGLLSYRVEGVLSEHSPEPLQQQPDEPRAQPGKERQRGPLIVCLDSSASMHGEAEDIAKAVCLEVLRLANEDQRQCHLFTFSGPGQVLELPLRFDPPGLRRILRFLAQSFHGGTDIQGPILRALDKLQEPQWAKADMLLITDGRFPVPDNVVRAVARARDHHGLHLQGLLVGRWASSGLDRICHPIHRFQPPSRLTSSA